MHFKFQTIYMYIDINEKEKKKNQISKEKIGEGFKLKMELK